MAVQIQAAGPEHRQALAAFNARLRAGGITDFKLPESEVSAWLPPTPGSPLFEELWLAVEDGVVRGGYLLKHQTFHLGAQIQSLGYFYSPVSEGLLDARFGALGLQLLLHAQRRQPLLYCLGMGGMDRPLPRLLQAARWSLAPVPFLFFPCRPAAIFRQLPLLRRSPWRAWLADALAASGLGKLALRAWQMFYQGAPSGPVQSEPVATFDAWVNPIWESSAAAYRLIAERTLPVLNRLYPPAKPRYLKLRVSRAGQWVGWAVLLDTPMQDSRHFGRLRVGSLIDCLALPGEEPAVAWAATKHLAGRGPDLLVANLSHRAWVEACRRAGWLSGPSNYIFAAAPRLASALQPWPQGVAEAHLTRGDGEGPTHL